MDPEPDSTSMRDEGADLVGRCENDISAVAHHTGADNGGRALLRTVVAYVGTSRKYPTERNSWSNDDFVGLLAVAAIRRNLRCAA